MKLRNKKTGEIDDVSIIHSANKIKGVVEHEDGVQCLFAYTLKEFNEEWEDYEEPKDDAMRVINSFIHYVEEADDSFCCDESVQKLVKKLEAWERLKDKGFRFNAWYGSSKNIDWEIPGLENESYIPRQICDDLDLLFGGEE